VTPYHDFQQKPVQNYSTVHSSTDPISRDLVDFCSGLYASGLLLPRLCYFNAVTGKTVKMSE